jgi:hypothetical protein
MDRKQGLFNLLSFILFFFFVSSVYAATYYVDKSHPQASDSNAGTSESLPWRTIQKAASTVVAGDTVFVKTGTYYQTRTGSNRWIATITQANAGTSDTARITFKVFPGNSVTLMYDPAETDKGPFIACKDYTTWDGFKIIETEANYQQDTGPVIVRSTGCNLLNLEISGAYICAYPQIVQVDADRLEITIQG